MTMMLDQLDQVTVDCLCSGGVVVMPTDTLYGIVASADNQQAVERVYQIKGRDGGKPPIVLISSLDQLYDQPSDDHQKLLDQSWPGPVSVILPSAAAPDWITRGSGSVAYRLPAHAELRALIDRTGPLIAPSANLQGQPPAMSAEAAREYFGEAVDIYVDGGELARMSPSQLLRLGDDGQIERLR